MIQKSFLYLFILLFFSCTYTQKINTGQGAYDLKQYAIAIDYLTEEYGEAKQSEQKASIAFLLGKSYQYTNNDQQALNWFNKSVGHENSTDALRELAFAYKKLENYPAAISNFEKLQNRLGKNAQITREINICRQAIGFFEKDDRYEYTTTALGFNSAYNDYGLTRYGEFLVFTSDRNESEGDALYNWTGNSFSDLYLAAPDGAQPQPFDADLNTDFNEGTACFSQDLDEMIFTRCYAETDGDEYCKLMRSFKEDGIWSEPKVLNFVRDGINYGHPCFIENDDVLVFALQKKGSKGFDLYYSERTRKNWSQPAPLPDQINSQGNEKFPTSHGDTLFFSSDYWPGIGGFDIFMTVLDNGEWSNPVNLKSPINSGADDFSFILKNDSRQAQTEMSGYFSSNRNISKGDDIFYFEKRIKENIEIIEEPKEEPKDSIQVFLAVKVVAMELEDPTNPQSEVIDKIPLNDATIVIDRLNNQKFQTDNKGILIQEIAPDGRYRLKVSKENYLSKTKDINTNSIDYNQKDKSYTINVEVVLDRLIKNEEIVLKNIYYDFDRWEIREDAQPSLNELAKILKDNPEIKIQLASHTDCQGNDAYNLNLSQKRAQSATDFIVQTGIASSRIQALGYGETALINQCKCRDCSEEDHQENRRTTFKIID